MIIWCIATFLALLKLGAIRVIEWSYSTRLHCICDWSSGDHLEYMSPLVGSSGLNVISSVEKNGHREKQNFILISVAVLCEDKYQKNGTKNIITKIIFNHWTWLTRITGTFYPEGNRAEFRPQRNCDLCKMIVTNFKYLT